MPGRYSKRSQPNGGHFLAEIAASKADSWANRSGGREPCSRCKAACKGLLAVSGHSYDIPVVT